MTDTYICPDCRTELTVEEYGRNLQYSECDCKIDVFSDSAIRVDTPVGTI